MRQAQLCIQLAVCTSKLVCCKWQLVCCLCHYVCVVSLQPLHPCPNICVMVQRSTNTVVQRLTPAAYTCLRLLPKLVLWYLFCAFRNQ